MFVRRSSMPVSAEDLFRWHSRPGAFERLSPPWEEVRVLSRRGAGIEVGAQVEIKTKIGPLWQRWLAEHTRYEEGRLFQDRQVSGPFSFWEHTHLCEASGPGASYLEDRVEYSLPLGALGRLFGGGFARNKLETMFAFRHRITADDLGAHQRAALAPQRILLTGATGLLGAALRPFLSTGGHTVVSLVRNKSAEGEHEISWDPDARILPREQLEGFDAVIHLAGEPVAQGRWNEAKKARIRDSRVHGTTLLCEALASLSRPPKVLLSASAIGIYGNRGEEPLHEESRPGEGFLAEVCKAWEESTQPAQQKGIRTVHLRIGIVLSPKGGMLAQLLPVFRAGVGGRVGSGQQYVSWISLDDTLDAILRCLSDPLVSGPVNLTAPHPVSNAEFSAVLGRVLSRPAAIPAPAAALKLAFGEMAEEAALAGAKVLPLALQKRGHHFRFPELEPALRFLTGRGIE
jgi:hypothetical protein